eukprot:59944_1
MNRFKRFVKTERSRMHEIKSKKADDKIPEISVETDKTQLKEHLELKIRLKAENLELKTQIKIDAKILELKERLKTETDKNQQYIMDIHRLKEERERLYRMADEENKLLISLFIMMTEMTEKEIRRLCSGAIEMHAIKKNLFCSCEKLKDNYAKISVNNCKLNEEIGTLKNIILNKDKELAKDRKAYEEELETEQVFQRSLAHENVKCSEEIMDLKQRNKQLKSQIEEVMILLIMKKEEVIELQQEKKDMTNEIDKLKNILNEERLTNDEIVNDLYNKIDEMEMQMNIKKEENRKLKEEIEMEMQMNHLKLKESPPKVYNGIDISSSRNMVNTFDNAGTVYTNKLDNTETQSETETRSETETELGKEKEQHVAKSLSHLDVEDISTKNNSIHLQILEQSERIRDNNIISKNKEENNINSKYINKKYLGFVLLPTNLNININQCISPDVCSQVFSTDDDFDKDIKCGIELARDYKNVFEIQNVLQENTNKFVAKTNVFEVKENKINNASNENEGVNYYEPLEILYPTPVENDNELKENDINIRDNKDKDNKE